MTRRRTARRKSPHGKADTAPPPPPSPPTDYEGRVAGVWLLLAIFLGIVGLLRFQLTEERVRLWWYSERYVPAEFDVQKVAPLGRKSREAYRFEGVVRPSGEAVVGYSRDLVGGPRAAEMKGQTLSVLHWPNRGEKRWLQPPTVVLPDAIPSGEAAAVTVLSWVALLAAVVLCLRPVRRSYKQYRASRPPEPPTTWADVGMIVLYFAVLGTAAYFISRP